MTAPAVAVGDAAARRVPWFEPHHCNELFHALPPPSANASAIGDAKVRHRVSGWAGATWTAFPSRPATVPLALEAGGDVDPRTWRERLGNLKALKAGGSFTKVEWRADMIAQAKRNKFSTSGTGRKRKVDADGELIVEEPVYYRTLKVRIRFSDPVRQRKVLNGYCGSARYTFNRALQGVQRNGMPLVVGSLRDRYVVTESIAGSGQQPTTPEGWAAKAARDAKKAATKARVGYETGELVAAKPWLKWTPSSVRSEVIGGLLQANTALQSKAKLARERGEASRSNQEWEFHPKTKEDPADSTISIEWRKLRDFQIIDRPTRKTVRVCDENPEGTRRKWTSFMMFDTHKKLGKSSCPKCFDGQTLGELYLNEDLSSPKFGGDGVHPIAIEHDCKLSRDARGRFYLHIPLKTELPEPKPLTERAMGGIDPGARTPFAAWGETGYGSYGDDAFKTTVLPVLETLDILVGRRDRAVAKWEAGQWTTETQHRHALAVVDGNLPVVVSSGQWLGGLKSYKRTIARLEHRIAGLRARVKNLVDDMHKRVARSLLEQFDTVLIPVFETHKMVEHLNEETGRRRVITSGTARALMTWAHYRFRSFLKHKALMLGKEVVVVDESYTTKGCSCCGLITDIGGNKTFTCQYCGFSAPRDAKSARDIFAKHIVAPL